MEGIVFDIQRFALHDGPGIRTAVFLKGCPLRCVWCCNPESQSPKLQLSFKADKCTHCMKCISHCEYGALANENGKLKVLHKKCNGCGLCIQECPVDALKIYGWKTNAESVIAEVEKDCKYYENSGGGLTVSGGEPLDQYEFLIEILKLAKSKNIHTCIETSGFAPQEQLKMVIPFVNLFLFDYKVTDELDFKRFIKVDNKTILKNLEYLCFNNANIILRCPVIPELNDNEGHFRAIADLSIKYDAIGKVEIMPYHDWGSHKYNELGMDLYPIDSKAVKEEVAWEWVKKIRNFGGRNISKG